MVAIGKLSPPAMSPVTVTVVERFLDGSGLTTAGTSGPTECSSMV